MLPIHRGIRATFALMLAGALAACDDPTGPEINQQAVPFYYYEDERIYLRVDGTRLTAVPEAEGDSATFRAVLTQAGVTVDSIRPMPLQQGHWFIHVPPRTSARRAEYAARRLRLDPRVRFASATYRIGGCPLYMVNQLVVQFHDADEAAIDQLNARTGVRNEQVSSWGVRSYEYPADMAATPLEMAAHYYRHTLVDWAEAGRVDGCLRFGSQAAAR